MSHVLYCAPTEKCAEQIVRFLCATAVGKITNDSS